MNQPPASQLFRPYVPATLRDPLAAGLLRPGHSQTYQATILYTDLSGFTRLTSLFAALPDGAERLHGILTRYFETMIATIAANGGDVIHIAGDALTAWWPGVTDPTLAMQCGHALHNAIATLNPINTPAGLFNLDLRVGISAGTVHLLLIGIPSYGIHPVLLGTPVNAASQAEQRAQPGEVQVLIHEEPPPPPITVEPLANAPTLSWEHFLPPSYTRRLRLNMLVAEYRRCVPVFAAFDLPQNPLDLQPLVAQAQTVAMRWGGWLNEIEIGNKGAVMVFLFGAPVAHGDDTSRAVGCALELRDRGVIRKAGISIGSLFAGDVGSRIRRIYTAQGEDMNLAALLMERANDGDILISGRVRQDILGRYRASQPQLLTIKGFDRAIPAAIIQSERIQRDERGSYALRAALPGNVNLIGRSRERHLIDQAIAAITQRSQLVLIEGESGIGKSSLLHYLGLEWLKRGYHGLRGECRSGAQDQSLTPWRVILSELCSIDESAPDQLRQTQFQRAMQDLPVALPSQIAALADFLDIPGFAMPSPRPDFTSLAIELLLRAIQKGPVLIMLEDAHWADEESLRLLTTIIDVMMPQLPLLIAISWRPLAERTEPLISRLRQHPCALHLIIERLPSSERINLIRELIGAHEIDPRLLQYLERYAAGQPLFIKEYVRLLLQRGLIVIEQGVARLVGSLPHVQLSSSALGIVQARIDQMEEQTRLTFKVAAAIGRSFPFRLLRDIHPAQLSEEELRHDIATLIQYQLIDAELADPEPVYRFTFGIVHETAYTSLLFAQRRALHQAIVHWYQTAYRADLARADVPLAIYDVIIEHAIRAEAWPIAIEHCAKAAFISMRRSLFNSALRYIEQGIGISSDLARRAELIIMRLLLHARIGNHLAQRDDFTLLQQIGDNLADPPAQGLASALSAHYMLMTGQVNLLPAHITDAQKHIDRISQLEGGYGRRLQALIWLLEAHYLALHGQPREALVVLRKIDRLCATLTYQQSATQSIIDLVTVESLQAQSLELQGWISLELGAIKRSQHYFQRAVEIARSVSDWVIDNRALIGLGHTMIFTNQSQEAARLLEAGLQTSRSLGDRYGQVLGLRAQALLHINQDDVEGARRLIWQAIAIANSAQIATVETALLNQLEGLAGEIERTDPDT